MFVDEGYLFQPLFLLSTLLYNMMSRQYMLNICNKLKYLLPSMSKQKKRDDKHQRYLLQYQCRILFPCLSVSDSMAFNLVTLIGVAAMIYYIHVLLAGHCEHGERWQRRNIADVAEYASLEASPDPQEVRDCERYPALRVSWIEE